MKALLRTLFFLLLALQVQAQGTWEWQHPYPQGNDLNSLKVFNKDTVIVVGGAGMVLRTTDGGLNWTHIQSGIHDNLNSVFFLNDSVGWIGGVNRALLKTTDGGLTWTPLTVSSVSVTGYDISSVFFIDKNHGWVCGGSNSGFMTSTSDGGLTWSNAISKSAPILSIYFTSIQKGWAVGTVNSTDYGLYKTNNGGTTWTQQYVGMTGDSYYRVAFTDSLRGWAVGDHGKVIRTTDGGNTWTIQSSTTTLLAEHSVFLVNDSSAWVCGHNPSSSMHTTNYGAHWTHVDSSSYGAMDIAFANDSIGWVVGYDGFISKTSNAGMSWHQLSSISFQNLYSVEYADSIHGWAGATGGDIYKTVDGGKNWILYHTHNPGMNNISVIRALNKDTVFAVGGNYISKSTDGGLTWVNVLSGITLVSGLSFASKTIGWATGDEQSILKTVNGGLSWNIIAQGTSGDSPYTDVWFTDSLHGVLIGGNRSCISYTSNGGITWTYPYVNGSSNMLSNLSFFDKNNGIASGGILMRTMDGGATWTLLPHASNAPVAMTDPLHAFFCGAWYVSYLDPSNYFTPVTTYEITWQTGASPACDLYGIHVGRGDPGTIVGTNGTILKYTGCHVPVPVITCNGNVLTSSPGLSYQWYNNLNFTNMTTQSYTVTTPGNYNVVVTDASGCQSTSMTYNFSSSTSVQEITRPGFITCFPNPFNAHTLIPFSEGYTDATLTIFNGVGEVVREIPHLNSTLYTFYRENLSSGIYFFRLSNAGKTSLHGKLIVTD